ncbi:ecto-ADP-ribosyltransferase 4-like [Mastacembelus armatus]|uniref:NAD(P)(+)--arginine ADP-ribosyltransferase n=1 Tax=Mastacembelus armatus TaxID=205130 RepID=A0A7N9AWT6_9TELE|nr:ecto-ADP-ribosyltransferase 4-like [Mastacembelus armatus]
MLLLKTRKDMKFEKRPWCELISLRNWATVWCLVLVVALLLYYDLFLILWWPQNPAEETKTGPLPLDMDMATSSVDDMFDGCQSETASVIHLFGVFEWHYNRNFSIAWASAERNAKKPVHKHLNNDHTTVMYIYTKVKHVQQNFNKAVKTGKHAYGTGRFKFHYFYFYLTEAIQILHRNQTACRATYHRTWNQFNHVINTNMRFGSFTLAASTKQAFGSNGNMSCFQIYTCFGADITYYSTINHIGQVLIPPYEVFRIIDVQTNDPWCRVVYKLQSTKTPRRDLNCKLNQRQIKPYFAAATTHWHPSSVGMMLAYAILLIITSLVLIKLRQKCFVATVLGALLVLMLTVLMLK